MFHGASCPLLCGTRSTCDSRRAQKGKCATTSTASSRPRCSDVVLISPTSLLPLLRKLNSTRRVAQLVVPKQAAYATHDALRNTIIRSLIRQFPRGLAAQQRFRHLRDRIYFLLESNTTRAPGVFYGASCPLLCGTRSTCDP